MPADNKIRSKIPCALFWDESFLWGLMAWKALTGAGLPFELIRSDDIRSGGLASYQMIFVPGGWAASKVLALGKKGQMEIRRFVENGGSYLGICGGAGLATDSHLGLLPVYRKSNAERVPSFSGPIRLTMDDHPIWNDIKTPVFSAWWPPQLHTAGETGFRILARYSDAEPEAMSADIRVADARREDWLSLENKYGIFLNPARLKGEPAVVEGGYGRGKVILSLVHFDTPGDSNGAIVLRNLWRYLTDDPDVALRPGHPSSADVITVNDRFELATLLNDIQDAVNRLIAEGEQRRLWRRRNDLLLQWRRGVRGMEYSTLAALTEEIAARFSGSQKADSHQNQFRFQFDPVRLKFDLESIRERLIPFVDESIELLRLEYLQLEETFTEMEDDPGEKIKHLRPDLFGSARHFGGKFKPLIDTFDALLYHLIKPVT